MVEESIAAKSTLVNTEIQSSKTSMCNLDIALLSDALELHRQLWNISSSSEGICLSTSANRSKLIRQPRLNILQLRPALYSPGNQTDILEKRPLL